MFENLFWFILLKSNIAIKIMSNEKMLHWKELFKGESLGCMLSSLMIFQITLSSESASTIWPLTRERLLTGMSEVMVCQVMLASECRSALRMLTCERLLTGLGAAMTVQMILYLESLGALGSLAHVWSIVRASAHMPGQMRLMAIRLVASFPCASKSLLSICYLSI